MKEKANLLRKSFISTLTAFVINTFLIFVLLFLRANELYRSSFEHKYWISY